jgi:hypothetical protein
MVGAGLKSPMDFTLGLARGFHNAPKLYGDNTVRPQEKVTDFQSGLKAAGKVSSFSLLHHLLKLFQRCSGILHHITNQAEFMVSVTKSSQVSTWIFASWFCSLQEKEEFLNAGLVLGYWAQYSAV